MQDRGHRGGHPAVAEGAGGVLAAADADGGAHDAGDPELLEGRDHAHHVGDRVVRADLVEVHPVHVGAVDGGLRLRERREDRGGPVPDPRGERGGGQGPADVGPAPVGTGGRVVGVGDHLGPGDPEPVAHLVPEGDVGGDDRPHRGPDRRRVGAGVPEGREQHVPGGPAPGVDPQRRHDGTACPSWAGRAVPGAAARALARATRAAWTPAP